jgi:threonine/homoserine/homoserine lactone efflux protein
MLIYSLMGITYGFAAAVMPGPLSAYLISQSLRDGWRRTLPAACAPLLSDGPIAVLMLLLLSSVPLWLEQWLRFTGGVFLLYLGVGAFNAWRRYRAGNLSSTDAQERSLLKATLVNLLNPHPYLGWSLVLGPLLLKGWREAPANGIAIVAGFYAAMLLSLAGIILLFGAATNLGPKVSRALIGVSALALACFGFYQLWLGAMAFWSP